MSTVIFDMSFENEDFFLTQRVFNCCFYNLTCEEIKSEK